MTAGVISVPFSQEIRDATVNAHGSAQRSGFMADLFGGLVTRERYARYVAQQWFIYDAIERAAATLADDPVARPFLHSELTRVPAVEADLEFLAGPAWRELLAPTPETAAYVTAIECASTTAGGFVAHHYVRYLGDLSGGQHIAKVIAAKLRFDDGQGVRSLAFAIDDLDAFKDGYRRALDNAPWNESERTAVVAEILGAYRLATDVLTVL
jgi:heme oxygenase